MSLVWFSVIHMWVDTLRGDATNSECFLHLGLLFEGIFEKALATFHNIYTGGVGVGGAGRKNRVPHSSMFTTPIRGFF